MLPNKEGKKVSLQPVSLQPVSLHRDTGVVNPNSPRSRLSLDVALRERLKQSLLEEGSGVFFVPPSLWSLTFPPGQYISSEPKGSFFISTLTLRQQDAYRYTSAPDSGRASFGGSNHTLPTTTPRTIVALASLYDHDANGP